MSEKIPSQREILQKSGEPEPKKQVEERERRFLSALTDARKKIERPQNTPNWEIFLKKIDFPLLKKLFQRTAERCGIPAGSDINFIEIEKIFSGGTRSLYDHYHNLIFFRDNEDTNEGFEEVYGTSDLGRLSELVHEEAHAISKHICVGWIPREGRRALEGEGRYVQYQSGLAHGADYQYYLFFALDEAVVEKMSSEIRDEYLQSSNWPEEEQKIFKEHLKRNEEKLPYHILVSLLNSIIKKISESTELSEETIWGAFKRALLEGEKWEDTEVIELFNSTFGDEFFPELAHLPTLTFKGDEEKIEDFKNKYGLK